MSPEGPNNPMQAVYQRWAGLNKCAAYALVENDAKDVVLFVSPYRYKSTSDQRLAQSYCNICTENGRSDARESVGNREMKVKRVFAGEAICIGLNLDLTLDEEQMRQEFRKTGNLLRLGAVFSRNLAVFNRTDLKGWCELQGTFFQNYPEIPTELTVHLAKKVQDAGTIRAFLDCTTASVDTPNIRGTKKSACLAVEWWDCRGVTRVV